MGQPLGRRRNIEAGCSAGWSLSKAILERKELALSKGVRDFSTFFPIVDSTRIISREFIRSRGGLGVLFQPFDTLLIRKKVIRRELSKIEEYLSNDFHLSEISVNESQFAPHFYLLLKRTNDYLNGDWENLPEYWGEWRTFRA